MHQKISLLKLLFPALLGFFPTLLGFDVYLFLGMWLAN